MRAMWVISAGTQGGNMKHRAAGIILFGLLGLMSVPSMADTGKVKTVYTRDSDGLQLVEIEGRGARPACATQTYMVIRDEKSDSGKAQYAMLMAAFLADRTVTIGGSGTCTRWPDGENIVVVRYDR